MPRRMIDSEIWRNEKVGSLPDAGRLLFIGIFSNADDDGRLKASARFLKATVFPYDNEKTDDYVQQLRDQCAQLGLIRLYSKNGQEYLDIPGWKEHQRIRKDRHNPSKLPGFSDSGNQAAASCQPDDNQMSGTGMHSIGEGRGGQVSPDKNSLFPNGKSEYAHAPAANRLSTTCQPEKDREEDPCVTMELPPKTSTRKDTLTFGEASNVSLTPEEYRKLVERLGEQGAKWWIDELSLAKASKGYKSRSDYFTILAWERRPKPTIGGADGRDSKPGRGHEPRRLPSAEERRAQLGRPLR